MSKLAERGYAIRDVHAGSRRTILLSASRRCEPLAHGSKARNQGVCGREVWCVASVDRKNAIEWHASVNRSLNRRRHDTIPERFDVVARHAPKILVG